MKETHMGCVILNILNLSEYALPMGVIMGMISDLSMMVNDVLLKTKTKTKQQVRRYCNI